jgi:hypothetical protein
MPTKQSSGTLTADRNVSRRKRISPHDVEKEIITTAVLGSVGAAVGYALNVRMRVRNTTLWYNEPGDTTKATWSPILYKMLEFVRYAKLAPSSNNTQCWKFRIGENTQKAGSCRPLRSRARVVKVLEAPN